MPQLYFPPIGSSGRAYKLPVSATFYKIGSTYYMMDRDGTVTNYSTAELLLAAAKTAYPNGGRFHTLGENTITFVTDPLFELGGWDVGKRYQLSGEGWRSIWYTNTAGKNALTIRNKSCVDLFDMKFEVGAAAKHCIETKKDGTNEAGCVKSIWSNVWFYSAATSGTSRVMSLTNPMDIVMINVWAGEGGLPAGTPAVEFLNDSTTVNYGNCSIPRLGISNELGDGILFKSLNVTTGKIMNLNQFGHLLLAHNGAHGTSKGVIFDQGSRYNTIDAIDCEDYNIAVDFLGSASKSADKNAILSGYMRSYAEAFKFSANTLGNAVKEVLLDDTQQANKVIWSDAGQSNSVENTDFYADTGITYTITKAASSILKGYAGHGAAGNFFYENFGSSTGTGALQTIPHGLLGTPRKVVITPTASGATVSGLYADATNIYVTVTTGKAFNWDARL